MTIPEPIEFAFTPPPRPPLQGDEPLIGLGADVVDFWRFALHNPQMNAARGWLAEYLVWRAVGVARPLRIEWDAADVIWEGIKIEVKSSALLQAWGQHRHSALRFDGLTGKLLDERTGQYAGEKDYQADVYVFAVQLAATHEEFNALDVSQWRFAVLPVSVLRRIGVHSIGWSRVVKEAGGDIGFDGVKDAVIAAVALSEENR